MSSGLAGLLIRNLKNCSNHCIMLISLGFVWIVRDESSRCYSYWISMFYFIFVFSFKFISISLNIDFINAGTLWTSNLDRFPSAAMYHEIWAYDPQKSREAQKGEVTRKICQKLLRCVTQPKNVVNNKYCHELSLVARPVSYQK